jgi:ribosomal protein S27AE
MKVVWSSKQEFDECPRCDSVMLEVGARMICGHCAIPEIDRLREQVKRLTKRAADSRKRAQLARKKSNRKGSAPAKSG